MQISYRYHRKLIDQQGGIFELFDPEKNITVGAQVLRSAMESTDDAILSIGRYNSWQPEKAKPYARRVFDVYERLNLLRINEVSAF